MIKRGVIVWIVVLVITACSWGCPAAISQDVCVLDCSSLLGRADAVVLIESASISFVSIGREITGRSFAPGVLDVSQGGYVRSLPAVPATVLLVFVGFICVTLVRDCRFWFVLFISVLWVGYYGIHAVPRLALCLYERVHIKTDFGGESVKLCLFEEDRARCDIDGSSYIGLLNHLAGIPQHEKVSNLNYRIKSFSTPASEKNQFRFSQFIVEQFWYRSDLTDCNFANMTGRLIYFSPVFLSDNLSRGPPNRV